MGVLGAAGTGGAHAQGAGDLSQAPTAELEALAKTLENDAERKQFLDTLKGLIAARKAAASI
ncbi:MAG: hypothetical protein V3S87_09890, partial [Alphaproteobacteria bacterium]